MNHKFIRGKINYVQVFNNLVLMKLVLVLEVLFWSIKLNIVTYTDFKLY